MAENEWRQIKNAMEDLSLGEPTLDGVLDALNELHRQRHLHPPTLHRAEVHARILEDAAEIALCVLEYVGDDKIDEFLDADIEMQTLARAILVKLGKRPPEPTREQD